MLFGDVRFLCCRQRRGRPPHTSGLPTERPPQIAWRDCVDPNARGRDPDLFARARWAAINLARGPTSRNWGAAQKGRIARDASRRFGASAPDGVCRVRAPWVGVAEQQGRSHMETYSLERQVGTQRKVAGRKWDASPTKHRRYAQCESANRLRDIWRPAPDTPRTIGRSACCYNADACGAVASCFAIGAASRAPIFGDTAGGSRAPLR